MKIPKITNPLTILQKSRQQQADQRKIQEQEKLIEALKCPENRPRRRPAMKFASNITTGTK
jgi:hypothetical protein